jgi:hypothetical protein
LASFLNLLTTRHFLDDSNIASKKDLTKNVQQNYIANSLFCYNNCSQRGFCNPTGHSGFGQCHCDFGWTGVDCSINVRVPTGLLANIYPGRVCPIGYELGSHTLGCITRGTIVNCGNRFQTCSLTDSNTITESNGTFCGIIFSSLNILCDNVNPYSEPCPSGYSKYSWSAELVNNPTTLYTCQKDNIFSNDRSGTLCGFHSSLDKGDQVTCNGYYPARGKCPPGCILRQGTFPDPLIVTFGSISHTFARTGILSICVKDLLQRLTVEHQTKKTPKIFCCIHS